MGSSPRQCASTQCPVCQNIFDKAQDHHVGTSLYSPNIAPCDFFLFPKIKPALKGIRFESIDAVKAKVMELTNKLSEDDLQHCFQQWKIRMKRCRHQGGEYTEGENISIV